MRSSGLFGTIVMFLAGCASIGYDGPFESSSLDWTTFGGSPARTNLTVSEPVPPYRLVWTYNARGGMLATPLVRDSVVIASTLHGEIHLIAIGTGKRLGRTSLGGPIEGTPALDGYDLFVPVSSDDVSLVRIEMKDGNTVWKASVGPIESSPVLVGDAVVVSTLSGTIKALSRETGSVLWSFGGGSSKKPIRSSPAAADSLIICGGDDGIVRALRVADGQPAWSFDAGSSVFASPVAVNGLVVVATIGGTVCALQSSTGAVVWKDSVGAPVYAAPSADGSLLFVATSAGVLRAYDLGTWRLVWQFRAGSVINASPLVSGGHVVVGSLDKTVSILDKRTGRLVWSASLDGRVKVPAVTWNRYLLIVHEDKAVTAWLPEGPA